MIAGTIVLEDMSVNFLGGPTTVSLCAADTSGQGKHGATECTFVELACVLALMGSDDWPTEVGQHLYDVAEPVVERLGVRIIP